MGQMQSKKKLLFKQVRSGNVERIRALCQEGANLEWKDKKGNTPLILACMDQKLYAVAQVLIELGANVNGRGRPGSYDETPLYYAASRGLDDTVKLLLSNGANYNYKALERARDYYFTHVVRTIESHICMFSGWMREFYGPGLLDLFAPQLRSRRDARPQVVMALRDPNLEEPEEMHPNTSVTIVDVYHTTTKSLKLAPSIREGRQQLTWFCDACKGIPQPEHPPVVLQAVQPSAPPLTDDDTEAVEEGPMHYPLSGSSPGNGLSASVGGANTEEGSSGQCVICMNAPRDAVCVPCGHIAGCMSCLTEIKSNGLGCPICRANIDQIIIVYHV